MTRLSRRRMLALATAVAYAPGALAATPARRFDPGAVADAQLAYRRMRFSTAEAPFYWWMRGIRYGIVDNRPVPLFEMHVGSFMRCRDLDGGRYAVTSLELVFNTGLDDGRLLERWRNPFTGEELEMRVVPVGPAVVEHAPDGTRSTPQLPGSRIETQTIVRPAVVAGDDIWIHTEQLATVTPAEGPGRPFRVADMASYRSRVSAVLDTTASFVDCDVSYNDVTDWPRWMKMGDRAGTRFARASGKKVRDYAELPERYRALVAERFPAIARDPPGALDLPPFRFDR